MKKFNKILISLASIVSISSLPLVAASCGNNDKLNFTKHSFKNYNREYTIKDKNDLKAYWLNNKKDIPYVDVDEVLNTLEGLIDKSKFKVTIDLDKGEKTYEVINKPAEGQTDTPPADKIVFNWKTNKIFLTSTSFFYSILRPQELTNGARFLKTEPEYKFDSEGGIIFDLNKYKLNIHLDDKDKKNPKILLPFALFNTLFLSNTYNNMYFNGKTFTNLEGGIDSYSAAGTPAEAKERIQKDQIISKTQQTKEQREFNFNHMMFTMDNFYGLKRYLKFNSFEEWIGPEYKKKLLSVKPEEFHQAYIDLFHKKLNELHTRIDSLSYYNKFNPESLRKSTLTKEPNKYYGEYYNKFFATRDKLKKLFENTYNKKLDKLTFEDHIKYVKDDTAIIRTFGFLDGTEEEIKKPDAWKFDTYFLMKKAMEEISKKEKIKHIILDLSQNGGGSVLAMVRTLGFLTNKQILNREYDDLNKIGSLSKTNVDVFGDGQFKQHNYDEKYKWSVLVGINTFSAANQATSIINEMKIAKIIGKTSGGGMSAVIPVVLNDGTTVTISSPNNAVNGTNYDPIEGGIKPDVELEYDDFYKDEKVRETALKAHGETTTTPTKTPTTTKK